MALKERLTTTLREINARRRETEQALQKKVADLAREAEAAESGIPQLERDLEEAIRRIQADFERRKTLLVRKVQGTRDTIDRLRAEQEETRAKGESQLWAATQTSLSQASAELSAREEFLQRDRRERQRLEEALRTKPDLARVIDEYEKNRTFLQTLESAPLPPPTLEAIRKVVAAQMDANREVLRRHELATDDLRPPEAEDLLFVYEVGSVPPGTAALMVLVPCSFGDYERPNLDRPGLGLRAAAAAVRAVVEVQRDPSGPPPPVFYRDAGGHLLVTGILGEGTKPSDVSEFFEFALQESVDAIPEAATANLRLATVPTPSGVLGRFLGEED